MAKHPANRLARESSPYLLQHAHNPVEWFAWGEEAFGEARRRGVPIFLSIGYSTCYWCHVMERECFEDEAIARVMNERFVNVKVDREERPDVDDVYMAAVQMLTGHGGWPMSVFLEPEGLRPYWAGTYFPPRSAMGLPAFTDVLERMSEVYRTQREGVVKQAGAVGEAIGEKLATARPPVLVGVEQVGMAVQTLLTIFDRADGGFGRAPKFPQPVYLELLLEARGSLGDEGMRAAVDAGLRVTLDRMAIGGIFDQVGGGFHRYSVDTHWVVPHFEKMLYDNAQLMAVYAKASVVFGDAFYGRVARRIGEYVLREMTQESGAFSTAQDAEVDGREGGNYVWTAGEVRAAVGEDAVFALDVYGLNAGANFQDPHHPDAPAVNVLRMGARPEVEAARLGMSVEAFEVRVDAVNAKLLAVRNRRKQPRLDDKVIASWNGLMAGAFDLAGRLLHEPRFVSAAERAVAFVVTEMKDGAGGLKRVDKGSIPGVLEDYAMAAGAMVGMKESVARRLVESAYQRLGDGAGGLWDTEGGEGLFVRPRTTYDGAMPSGASVMLNVLIDLGEKERAFVLLGSISAAIEESPIATANATRGLLRLMKMDAPGLEAAQKAAGAVSKRQGETMQPLIEVYASEEEVEVGQEQPAEVHVRLVIPEGWHINDAFAGEESGGTVVPLTVAVTGGTGVRPFAEYPRGTQGEGMSYGWHEGVVEFPVVLERHGEWTGTPRLAIAYQACNDRACLAPVRVELEVEIRKAE